MKEGEDSRRGRGGGEVGLQWLTCALLPAVVVEVLAAGAGPRWRVVRPVGRTVPAVARRHLQVLRHFRLRRRRRRLGVGTTGGEFVSRFGGRNPVGSVRY